MSGTRRVLSAFILPLTLVAIGCGSKPSGPPVGANLDQKVTADELATLAGTWGYERQVGEGREVPIAELGKSTIVISGNSLVRNAFRADGQPLPPIKSIIYVDPTASPNQMDDDADVGFRISRRLGIYKLEGDRLTLCYDNTGKQRPTAFDSPAGSSFVLTVLRRQNSEKEPALKDADAYAARAYDWLCKGNYDKAIRDYDSALQLKPADAAFLNSRGFTWHMKSIEDKDRPACEDRALSDYAEAIRIDPKYASAINNRAWLWATSKVDRCRNGKQTVEEATKACELTGWKNAGYIDTLSVAYAEVGDFEQAIRWQRKALEDPGYQREEGKNAREKLALFGKKQPFRE